jgi:hypothetical protein
MNAVFFLYLDMTSDDDRRSSPSSSFPPLAGRSFLSPSSLSATQALMQNQQYAPPPGSPPSRTHYAPPSGPPPPHVDDEQATSEPPPPYTKNPTASNQALPLTNPDIKFERLSSLPALAPGAEGPLDPPPDCFTTPTPVRIRSHSFEPFRVPSRGARLLDGFEPLYPPSLLQHHGISAEDWAQFLRDVQLTAVMAERGVSSVAPRRMGGPKPILKGVLGGPRAVHGGPYDQTFVKTPQDEASDSLSMKER